jgi:pimeloyl-ACP methyl ester carboxylesterase
LGIRELRRSDGVASKARIGEARNTRPATVEAEQKLVWATQAVPVPDLFTQKVEGTAWKTKPSWYIVGKDDRTVDPDLERFVAKRMGATTVELASSHVPMLSQPHAVLGVIRNVAKMVASAEQG